LIVKLSNVTKNEVSRHDEEHPMNDNRFRPKL